MGGGWFENNIEWKLGNRMGLGGQMDGR